MRQLEITEQPIVRLSVESGQISSKVVAAERFVKGIWEDAKDNGGRQVKHIDWYKFNKQIDIGHDSAQSTLATLAMAYLKPDQITSLNFHPKTLAEPSFQKHFALTLQLESAGSIAMEIIETGPNLLSVPIAVHFLHKIKEFGAKIWLDDLDSPGSAHTLEWLKQVYDARLLCVDAIKLERSQLADWQITNAMRWAYGNGKVCVIEQVETELERDHLLNIVETSRVDLDYVLWQGHLWGKPEAVRRPRKVPLKSINGRKF